MEANIKAVMAEAAEVDSELNGSSNICGMVVVDNRGLCIAAEVRSVLVYRNLSKLDRLLIMHSIVQLIERKSNL